ncbi:molybdenum ABC transporter (ATP-binding protein) [Bradyrhizobium sp. ORS 285]|uniref:molybdenum ABC transporter ATP-binding protein n=1 Tax=Bradyrhizobium sp. ORS 285 TaxID=115808 RepID=UPI000240950C|nr:molybdenum ABC transporter ATP-binding protein [Bradyrhizobium sp. ORS 285]CCD87513.1 molybdenum ABC transporter (ATP-binding protein) [Bradyrhizobium sp. ORS 285]SMX60334.1 molybdenum ABC transporter (ATP-binding protein) [Bradyrhizobium sp. ORS 285]
MSTVKVDFRGTLGRFELNARFEVPARGVTAIFGPSGCGKTAVMRCIAGLNRLNGLCSVAGDVWQDEKTFRPVHQRPIGYVFQEANLFPHLSVRRNLMYGHPGKTGAGAIGFDEIVGLLGIARLLERSPRHLSGGERQRVAIGRALLSQPKLLLMDEPLSALDQMTKDEILPYLERLHAALVLPILYISHDIAEVERLADQLVLMRNGAVLASGPLSKLQADLSLPLALSRDAAVSLDATVLKQDATDGMATLDVDGGYFLVPAESLTLGTRRRLRVLADDVSLAVETPSRSTIVNVLRARILEIRSQSDHRVTALLGLGEDGQGARLLSRVTQRSWNELGIKAGLSVYAQVKGVALVRREEPLA